MGIIYRADNRERDEVHKTIWSIADDLRGAVYGWDFKQYILGIMFYRYISENITKYINDGERKAGDKDFDYALIPDSEVESVREDLVKEKGLIFLYFWYSKNRCPTDIPQQLERSAFNVYYKPQKCPTFVGY